jgi:hypothetical protein
MDLSSLESDTNIVNSFGPEKARIRKNEFSFNVKKGKKSIKKQIS